MIRWSALQVSKGLAEIQKLVDEAEPTLRKCEQNRYQQLLRLWDGDEEKARESMQGFR